MGLFGNKRDSVKRKLAAEDGTLITGIQGIIESGRRFLQSEGDVPLEKAMGDVEIEMEELEKRTEEVRQKLEEFEVDVQNAASDSELGQSIREAGIHPDRLEEIEHEIEQIEKDMETFRKQVTRGELENPLRAFDSKMENDWDPALRNIEKELAIET